MIWRIEIFNKEGVFDVQGDGVMRSVVDLGIHSVHKVEVTQVYSIEGELDHNAVTKICKELLTDPITQDFKFTVQKDFLPTVNLEELRVIEIAYNPGVMDPVEYSVIKGIRDLGLGEASGVKTAKEYKIFGHITDGQADTLVNKVLANKIIQHQVDHAQIRSDHFATMGNAEHEVISVDLIDAKDKALMKLSKDGQLFLNIEEMKTIQAYFKKLGRNPTDCELETTAQTWSEHCFHKTFRGNIEFEYKEKGKTKKRLIKNLLKSTIVKATQELDKKWCVSVFHDNAGVIEFDKESNVCFKVETHNHPSALEPFGGANTGIGGVIRDILGTGLGAKPICSTDVFCFAPPDTDWKDVPAGTLHPKRVMKGVVSGVRDYGNKMGIPTINGAIIFDPLYIGNPLVYCGNVGIMPKNKVFKKVNKGDCIVVAGGRTGRDGIHGATFSSGELTTDSEVVSSGAVQIGDPIQEKKVLDAMLIARDRGLYSAVTDCGAGGLSSAVGEMGQTLGAWVDLDKVPLKYQGLNYDEIWISESQERMVFSVPEKNVDEMLKVFASENVEATVIGYFTGKKKLELYYRGSQVCDIDMEFLHEGNPRITKKAKWTAPKLKAKKLPAKIDLNEKLLEVMGHYNICSKEWVIRQYDHEVQGGSIIKPLIGKNCDGPSDASVITPKLGSKKGIAISNGINARYGMIDPYWMAGNCIDEAVRQIVAVGGAIDRIAILDNFCWGNPDKPDRLGSLVRAAEGCYKFAVGYGVPFISGKDSLYNEYAQNKKTTAIPGTLLISAIGIVDDVSKTVTMNFKKPGSLIYVVGETRDEMGGAVYLDTCGDMGVNVPQVDPKAAIKTFKALNQATAKGLVNAMHDCSDGGLAVTLAEMAFAGNLGVTARIDKVVYKGKEKRDDVVMFSETPSRLVVEVSPEKQKKFEAELKGVKYSVIGRVENSPEFVIYGFKQNVVVNLFIQDLCEAWKQPLRW
ncbi:MAG: phosphoribosylformylglycinamidine synthase subunit PurL [Candidatus Omnitrophica bacterium]|nr:phosphoribosylformylglycinamidine synthase subunit PurL [Candidatus Omnitrophota bacterium]